MSDTTEPPEPKPEGEHRPVALSMQSGWLLFEIDACKACSRAQNRIVAWPCPVLKVEPISTAELDDELRELLGNKE